jgi:hypothetical protein
MIASPVLKTTQQSDHDTYRLIVLSQDGAELLLIANDGAFTLPSISIPGCQRVAENLTAALNSGFGYEAVCLFTLDENSAINHDNKMRYQVIECTPRSEERQARTAWAMISSLSEDAFADAGDHRAVRQALARCQGSSRDSTLRPFATLGWFGELREWVEGALQPLKLQLTGGFRQLNASPSCSLIRFETDGPAVWFKAIGEPNLQEFPITLTLAELFPQHVPAMIATRPEWNGWLATEIQGVSLGETLEINTWMEAASSLANLQIDSIGKQERLLSSGVRDLTIFKLLSLFQPFMEEMERLMDRQVKLFPAALTKEGLLSLGEHIQRALLLFKALEMPETLGNLDLNPGNAILSADRCVFLDWADACVSHPFFTFEYLREHFRRTFCTESRQEAELTRAYIKPWQPLLSSGDVAKAVEVAPLLAVFSFAAGSSSWGANQRTKTPKEEAYLRSLVRRMKHEADQLITENPVLQIDKTC